MAGDLTPCQHYQTLDLELALGHDLVLRGTAPGTWSWPPTLECVLPSASDGEGHQLLKAVAFFHGLELHPQVHVLQRQASISLILATDQPLEPLVRLLPLLETIRRRDLDYRFSHDPILGTFVLILQDLDQLGGASLAYDYFGWQYPLALTFVPSPGWATPLLSFFHLLPLP